MNELLSSISCSPLSSSSISNDERVWVVVPVVAVAQILPNHNALIVLGVIHSLVQVCHPSQGQSSSSRLNMTAVGPIQCIATIRTTHHRKYPP